MAIDWGRLWKSVERVREVKAGKPVEQVYASFDNPPYTSEESYDQDVSLIVDAWLDEWPLETSEYVADEKEDEEYANKIEQIIGCGCYDPDLAEEPLEELFGLFEQRPGSGSDGYFLNLDKFNALVRKRGRFVVLALYWLKELGYAEHGGSVIGSWLSDKGVAAKF